VEVEFAELRVPQLPRQERGHSVQRLADWTAQAQARRDQAGQGLPMPDPAVDCVPLALAGFRAMYRRLGNRRAVMDEPAAWWGVAKRDWPALMERLAGIPERVPDRDLLVAAMQRTPGAMAVVRAFPPNRREHVFLLISDDREPGRVTVQVVDAQVPGAGGLNGGTPQPVHEVWLPDTQVALFDGDGRPTTLSALASGQSAVEPAPGPGVATRGLRTRLR
jgi:hypothetical protein